MELCLNFLYVLEGKPNIVSTVDGGVFHQRAPAFQICMFCFMFGEENLTNLDGVDNSYTNMRRSEMRGEVPLTLGHPIGASSIPIGKGISKGNSVSLCLGCSEGIAFPFDRKNPKKSAVSWHTIFRRKV